MALRGVTLRFPAQAPSLASLIAKAGAMGTMKLLVLEEGTDSSSIAFAAFPENLVTVKPVGPSALFISSLTAPTLYELLWQAAAQLGATKGSPFGELPMPLTENEVRRRDQRDSRKGLLVTGLACSALLSVLVVLAVLLHWRAQ